MNSVQLVGRLTRDPDVRYSDGGTTISRFTVAVNRRLKRDEADFINCVAFKGTAEFVEKWFHKGDLIVLSGSIRTGSYTKDDGTKVYTTEVYVDNVEFGGGRGTSENAPGESRPAPSGAVGDGFMNIPDGVEDEGLPFN